MVDLVAALVVLVIGLGDFLTELADKTSAFVAFGVVVLNVPSCGRRVQ